MLPFKHIARKRGGAWCGSRMSREFYMPTLHRMRWGEAMRLHGVGFTYPYAAALEGDGLIWTI